MIRARILLAPLVAGLALASGSLALSSPDDDDDDREAKLFEARATFVGNCLMCHGEEMTARHRLTPKQWTTEVEKMIGWGAPVPSEQKQMLIDYLAATYPDSEPAPPVERLAPDQALAIDRPGSFTPPPAPPADVLARGQALFAQNCANCHGPEAKGGDVGTNLVEKPVLLRDDEYHALMRDGRRRMPGFATVLDARAEADLLAWLRDRR